MSSNYFYRTQHDQAVDVKSVSLAFGLIEINKV